MFQRRTPSRFISLSRDTAGVVGVFRGGRVISNDDPPTEPEDGDNDGASGDQESPAVNAVT